MRSKTIFIQNKDTKTYVASGYLDTDEDHANYSVSILDAYTTDTHDIENLRFTRQQLKDLNQKIAELLIEEEVSNENDAK